MSKARTTWTTVVLAGVVATLASCGGGAGSSYSPAAPTTTTGTGGTGGTGGTETPPSTSAAGTITITSAGSSPKALQIEPGQTVTFVNHDSRAHEIESDPHPVHTDCPPTNSVGLLQPGASRTTAAYTAVRNCGFHDHLDPENDAWRGTIQVGTTGNTGPGYVR